MPSLTSTASSAERTAANRRSDVARIGLVGRALLYVVFGLFAIDVAVGSGGASSTQGAFEQFADRPYGKVLLLALCIGLVALVVWKALQTVAGDPVEGSDPKDRANSALKTVIYGAALFAAVSVLIANWSSASGSAGSDTKQQATATVLDWPAGQFLVIAAGIGIIGFGLAQLWTDAWQGEFMERIDTSSVAPNTQHSVEVVGRAGYLAKGVTTVLIGIFLLSAGWQHDPDDTTGLSGALTELGDSGRGTVLLWIVAIGMLGFAAFSLVEAKLRRAC